MMKILIVVTSHAELGASGEKTGLWYEEFAAPYYVFSDAGHTVTVVSPKGGQPPIDPMSTKPPFDTEATRRLDSDEHARAALADTGTLTQADPADFDAVFYPGGHGPLFDLAKDAASIALIETFYAAGKPVAAVCHAPGALRHVHSADGQPLVTGRRVTGFTNEEERAVGRTAMVPFLVEDELNRLGGLYEKVSAWQSHVITDGQLITGQNPASAEGAARALLNRQVIVRAPA